MYCRDVVKFRNCFTFIAVSNNLRHGYIYIYIYIYIERERERGEREREREEQDSLKRWETSCSENALE